MQFKFKIAFLWRVSYSFCRFLKSEAVGISTEDSETSKSEDTDTKSKSHAQYSESQSTTTSSQSKTGTGTSETSTSDTSKTQTRNDQSSSSSSSSTESEKVTQKREGASVEESEDNEEVDDPFQRTDDEGRKSPVPRISESSSSQLQEVALLSI